MTLQSMRTEIRREGWRVAQLLAAFAVLGLAPLAQAAAQEAGTDVGTDVGTDAGGVVHSLVRPAYFPPQQIARLDLDEPTLIDVLLDALPTLSRYSRPAMPPRLVYLPTAEIRARACSVPCPVLAYYAGGAEIFLDHRLNPLISLFDRSIVLHEMVHYLQAQQTDVMHAMESAGPRERCRIWYARESEAYAVQQTFLALVHSSARAGRVPRRLNC